MRTAILAAVAGAALVMGAATAISQTNTDEPGTTGQAVRPASPKQIEPESQSHNAEKPRKNVAKKDGAKPDKITK